MNQAALEREAVKIPVEVVAANDVQNHVDALVIRFAPDDIDEIPLAIVDSH